MLTLKFPHGSYRLQLHGDPMDVQQLIDKAKNNLARRTTALQATLDEIALVEPSENANPGMYTPALRQLRTKRDRQQAAVLATEALIKSLITALKKR